MAKSLGKSEDEPLWSSPPPRPDGSDANGGATLSTYLDLGKVSVEYQIQNDESSHVNTYKHRRPMLNNLPIPEVHGPPQPFNLNTQDEDAYELSSTSPSALQKPNSDDNEGNFTTPPTNDPEDADANGIDDSDYTCPTNPPNSPKLESSMNTTPLSSNEGLDNSIAPSRRNIQADGLSDDLVPNLLNRASVSGPKRYAVDDEHTKSLIKDLLRTLSHHETTLGRPIDINKDSTFSHARGSLSHVLLLVREIAHRYCQPPELSRDSDQTPNHVDLPAADFGAPCRSYTTGLMGSLNIPHPNSGRVPRRPYNDPGMALARPATRIHPCAAARAA